jgi:hypothetical protein
MSKEHQAQIDHLTKENKVSIDTIEQLKVEIGNIKIEHAKKLVVLQEDNKVIRKNHEDQVNILVAQINELKIKQKNSE